MSQNQIVFDKYKFMALLFMNTLCLFASPTKAESIRTEDIANIRLQPVDIIAPKQKNIYEKYGFSFQSECLCGTNDIVNNKKKNLVYIVNHCSQIHSDDTKTLKISKISESKGGVELDTESKYGNITFLVNRNKEGLFFVRSKSKSSVFGDMNVLKTFYTDEKNAKRFKKIDCEDFDG